MTLGKMALGKMAGWVNWRRVKWHWVKWNWVNCHVTNKILYSNQLLKILNPKLNIRDVFNALVYFIKSP